MNNKFASFDPYTIGIGVTMSAMTASSSFAESHFFVSAQRGMELNSNTNI
jgi:hypothetical protein